MFHETVQEHVEVKMNLQYGTNAMSSPLENHTFSIGKDSQLLSSFTQLPNISYTLLLYFPSEYMSHSSCPPEYLAS